MYVDTSLFWNQEVLVNFVKIILYGYITMYSLQISVLQLLELMEVSVLTLK